MIQLVILNGKNKRWSRIFEMLNKVKKKNIILIIFIY